MARNNLTATLIDQSQLLKPAFDSFGKVARVGKGQQFTPVYPNFSGFTFQKQSNQGSFTGTVTISIMANSGGIPSNTPLNSVVLSNAEWNAISVGADYYVALPYTLTIGQTYWLTLVSSTVDDSNFPQYFVSSTSVYSGGQVAYYTGTSWTAYNNFDFYFKTYFTGRRLASSRTSASTRTVAATRSAVV